MRTNLLLAVILVLVHLNFVAAQESDSPPKPGNSTASDQDNVQTPVVLTPVKNLSSCDLDLIDEVCQTSQRQVKVYSLKNAAAKDVAESINQWLKVRLESQQIKVDGFICNAPIIIVPELATNSLIVSFAADFKEKDNIERIIRESDRERAMLQIQAVLKKTVDGKTVVIGKPHLIMLDGTQGRITLKDGDESYTIELTPRVIDVIKPSQTVQRAAANTPVESPTKSR